MSNAGSGGRTLAKPGGSAAANRSSSERFTIAVIGSGPRVTTLVRMFADARNVVVGALCAGTDGDSVIRLAEDLGVFVTRDVAEIFAVEGLNLILNMCEDPETHAKLVALRPPGVEIVGNAGSDLVWDLLVAKKRGEEQERLLGELQNAYEQIRSHEAQLEASKGALESANSELESRFAEIFFTHEFFKALTSFTSVADVSSLIVDGCNGILGAEISCVYLVRREDWSFRLSACQGRPESAFLAKVPVSESILGTVLDRGLIQEADILDSAVSASWLSGEYDIASQAAVLLRTGDVIIGAIIIASADRRELSGAEMERLAVLANQSSLSLQNALLHAELERLSVTDRLTDLYNHGHMKQRLDEEFKRAARFDHTLSLIMLDIDDFKSFNDTFGHPRGDILLKAVSGVIRSNLRTMDVAARYGGEEFVVVLPETGIAGALAVAERIRADVEAIRLDGPESEFALKTVSVGVATFPDHAVSSLRLLESADAAMYRAKRAGKNRVMAAGV